MANTFPNRPGNKLHAEQIFAPFDFLLGLQGLTLAATASSIDITAALTAALASAGRAGDALPLQVSSADDIVGVVTNERVQVVDSASKVPITAGTGDEVYGRVTEAAGTYTLSLYYLDSGGTENTYTNGAAAKTLDICMPYRADFHLLPPDGFIAGAAKIVGDDPTGGGRRAQEQLTVTATNTLSSLATTPMTGTSVMLYVNGKAEGEVTGSFTRSGTALTWVPATAGYNLYTGFRVVAEYTLS